MGIDAIVAALKAQRARIDAAIAALEGTSRSVRNNTARGRRAWSPAARKRQSLAMKRRWAQRRNAH